MSEQDMIGSMERNEKLLLLQLILEDIRGNWGWSVEERLNMALQLARELELPTHIERIEGNLQEFKEYGDIDGRDFRTTWEHGGYEDGEKVHKLPSKIIGRSKSFQKVASGILTYPGYRFDDWMDHDDEEGE